MSAQLIDGNAIAEQLRLKTAAEIEEMVNKGLPHPGLAAVLVGERKDSQSYVSMKRKRAGEIGIESFGYTLPATASQEEVESLVRELNADPKVNGILVQLPLPAHLDDEKVLNAISIEKDVDGFHPLNIGRLAQKGREPLFVPCTPDGVMYLIEQTGTPFKGANAVVLGRSNIVGMPAALLLVKRDATVTICHSRSKDLPGICRQADILVAAVGRAEMVRGDWIKPGAVVIDVGTNAVDDPTAKRGYRWVGDVCFEEAKEVAGWITPVPGGVGPMTIAMLLRNTVRSARYVAEKMQNA
jgi:5,10-methylene-tetrahydrofolate dehydrogenase/methenyl tetrahydrofolate cyclohydrolase